MLHNLRVSFHFDITIKLRKKVITLYIAIDWKRGLGLPHNLLEGG
jgi:hypothetical protein